VTGATQVSESALYRESHPLVPQVAGYAILGWAVFMTAVVAWNWAQGQNDLVLSLPGVVAFLAIGLGAAVAKQYVEVTPTEIRVGNSPQLSRRIPLRDLQRLEQREHPPSRWTLTWPLGARRVLQAIPS